MSVKYKIRLDNLGNVIKIPLSLDFSSMDQSEVVNRYFVQEEVEKSINPIVDYERVRFLPLQSNGVVVKDLVYKLNFLDVNGTLLQPTTYSDIGLTDDDIILKKNRFTKSFLRLSFYDSDKPTNQNLMLGISIFPNVTSLVSEIPVSFRLNNPVTEPEGFAEGFNLYYFKSGLNKSDALPVELYMSATFNNASNGKITKFISTEETLPINELINKLHVKYLLTRSSTGYYYTIDTTYNGTINVIESGTNLTVNLFEIKVQ